MESFSSTASVVCAGLSSSGSRRGQLCMGSHGLRVVGEVGLNRCLQSCVSVKLWGEESMRSNRDVPASVPA